MLLSLHTFPYFCSRITRKVGRVIDRAGLEIRYTLFGYRGFESLTFRKKPVDTQADKKPPDFLKAFFVLSIQSDLQSD